MTKRRNVVGNMLHILGVPGSIFEKECVPN
jgi:hypothetical protein